MEDVTKIWQKVKDIIQVDILPVSFSTWIETIVPVDITVDTLILEVPFESNKQIILSRYLTLIQNALVFINQKEYEVDIRVKSKLRSEEEGRKVIIKQKANIGMHLNSSYTFDTFVIGKSNQLPHAIAKNIAQCVIDGKVSDYNPMFLYGGVGLGKTHLMHAICHEILKNRVDAKILYTTSEQFTNDLVNAIKDYKSQEFRDKYRTVDILLIDDIQFIGGKENTQEEFFHTFNELYQNGKHIVITSDRPPKELYTLEERLRTRFESSGIHDINPPDFETRIAILKKKADNINVEIDDEIFRFLAEQITSNIRELEGAIKMLKSYHNLMNREITLELAKEVLRDYKTVSNKKITLDLIAENVEKYCNLKENELKSSDRSKKVAYPRQIAMYIMKELTDYSLTEIGDFFGGKDHSTIHHGIKKIKTDMEEDISKKTLVDNIIKNIKN
jgi:chromosomal replication initiator protein